MVEVFGNYLTTPISLGHSSIDNKRGRLEEMLFSRWPLSVFGAEFSEREEFAYNYKDALLYVGFR